MLIPSTHDLRFAVRSLRRRPGFTAAIVATLALGIGAGTAMFSLIDAALLRPLPFRAPERLVVLWGVSGPERDIRGASLAEVRDWRALNHALTDVTAYDEISLNLRAGDGAERVDGEMVSSGYFSILGVNAARGRTFLRAEDQTADAAPVAVVSHDFWTRRYGADPSLVGRSIVLNDRPFTVVGVMPERFKGISFDTDIIIAGTHTSVSNEMPLNRSGITPTTVNGRSLSETDRPMMPGSALKRRCQSAWLITATDAMSGARSSSAIRVRPRSAVAPSSGK